MGGCTAINLVTHVKSVFVQVGVVCIAWRHLQELSQQSSNSCIHTALCTMTTQIQNLDKDRRHALQKWLLSSHPWPNMNDQCTLRKKNKQKLSSTDNNFMSFLFDFERFRIESRFPFFWLTLYSRLTLNGFNDSFIFSWNCSLFGWTPRPVHAPGSNPYFLSGWGYDGQHKIPENG